jgi:3-hydroxyisobutyrate dehydrogenase-like beta-hydroxyacid dehydrogenase
VVWNRTADKCAAAVAAGALQANSARAAAAASDITFAMLSDPEAALAVMQGAEGAAAGLSAGKGYVDVSTVDAATSKQVDPASPQSAF